MSGVNKVIIVGRLGRDPEVRNFTNGGKVVNLRVATSETWKDKSGERQERTEWHSIAIFNEKLGEIAEKYLRKGSEAYIEGALETRKWQDQNGADKYTTEIVLRQFRGEIALLGGRAGGDGEARAASRETASPSEMLAAKSRMGGGARPGGKGSDLADDIPFGPEFR